MAGMKAKCPVCGWKGSIMRLQQHTSERHGTPTPTRTPLSASSGSIRSPDTTEAPTRLKREPRACALDPRARERTGAPKDPGPGGRLSRVGQTIVVAFMAATTQHDEVSQKLATTSPVHTVVDIQRPCVVAEFAPVVRH